MAVQGSTDPMKAPKEEFLDEVTFWRYRALTHVGHDSDDALEIATHVEVDLHQALELVSKGCPQALAVRILL
jgi:hypothetical protein